MRGKGQMKTLSDFSIRITPAYAGKSSVADKTFTPQRDHPRLCGEKGHICMIAQNESGSPPPMRGKDGAGGGGKKMKGITPAYAGKSG